MENAETEVYKGYTITVNYDQDYESPEAWGDDTLFLVGYHRDFYVEGPRIFSKLPDGIKRDPADKGRLLVEKQELIEYFTPKKDREGYYSLDHFKAYWIFPLEAYIHSGVILYLSGGCQIDRQWDVSQLGAVFVSKKEWRLQKSALNAAEGLIKTWNLSLSGQCYWFTIEDPEGKWMDSCGGYLTDNIEKDILVECRATIDRDIPKRAAKIKELNLIAANAGA